jgi:hypothetical protein
MSPLMRRFLRCYRIWEPDGHVFSFLERPLANTRAERRFFRCVQSHQPVVSVTAAKSVLFYLSSGLSGTRICLKKKGNYGDSRIVS